MSYVFSQRVGIAITELQISLLTYLRYNTFLDENGLNELGLAEWVTKINSLRDMSAGGNRFALAKIGQEAAKRQISDDHFPTIFVIAV